MGRSGTGNQDHSSGRRSAASDRSNVILSWSPDARRPPPGIALLALLQLGVPLEGLDTTQHDTILRKTCCGRSSSSSSRRRVSGVTLHFAVLYSCHAWGKRARQGNARRCEARRV